MLVRQRAIRNSSLQSASQAGRLAAAGGFHHSSLTSTAALPCNETMIPLQAC